VTLSGVTLAIRHRVKSRIVNTYRGGTTSDTNAIEQTARLAYDSIAVEYYSQAHPNSQLFEKTVESSLENEGFEVQEGSTHLEVGAGGGTLQRLSAFQYCRIVLSDISSSMLKNVRSQVSGSTVSRVICSAFALPFRDKSFAGIYSFLGDPFALRDYFLEARRVLQPRGHFVFINPSTIWGHTLRKQIGLDVDSTVFRKGDGSLIQAPSFLYEPQEMVEMLTEYGFTQITARRLYLPRNISELTSHLTIPSRKLGVDPHELPILDMFRAFRPTP
jgi:ubiquinone/menaquinone biosynthesis C-methylase UbiE